MVEICTWRVTSTDIIASPCTTCGHTTLAHPGVLAPGRTGCILCEAQFDERALLTALVESLLAVAPDQATSSRDFGRGYMHAVRLLASLPDDPIELPPPVTEPVNPDVLTTPEAD